MRDSKADLIREAIVRLADGRSLHSPSTTLNDQNLILEAGVSRATFYRDAVALSEWRAVKQGAILATVQRFETRAATGLAPSPTEEELLNDARVERAALLRMPGEIQQRWARLKAPQRETSKARSKDEVIDALVSRLYAANLALRKRDEIIQKQAELIERLRGNVIRL